MPQPYPLSVEFEGHRYRGQYTLVNGQVCASLYGYGATRCDAPAGRPLLPLAEELALRLVKTWLRERALEDARIDRETQRIARGGRPRRARARPRLSPEELTDLKASLPPVTRSRTRKAPPAGAEGA